MSKNRFLHQKYVKTAQNVPGMSRRYENRPRKIMGFSTYHVLSLICHFWGSVFGICQNATQPHSGRYTPHIQLYVLHTVDSRSGLVSIYRFMFPRHLKTSVKCQKKRFYPKKIKSSQNDLQML